MSGARTTRWGYHRLTDRWARRLVAQADIGAGDLVLDLGAGTGAISAPLVDAGARVLAFELHPKRAAILRERFGDDPVKVVRADLADLRLPRRPFRVVANPPFGATTAVLRRLTSTRSALTSADLIVPAHVAARWANGRGASSRRSSGPFHASVARRLPPDAFRPVFPKPTVVLRIDRIA